MAINYPVSLDNGTSIPTPNTTDKRNSPSHGGLHGLENSAIIAVETKIGTGASTPVANTLLFGTGTGTSAWTALTSAQLLAVLTDETGTGSNVFATTPTLITPKVDTINENTLNNGTTIGGVNIKSGALNTNNSVVTANITDSAVTSAKLATGVCVQMVSSVTGAVATGTTVLPLDDTIPQNTEGDQYLSVAITPKSTTNNLVINVNLFVSCSAIRQLGVGLFQDATANAISGTQFSADVATGIYSFHLTHPIVAGTVSATTFKVRIGPSSAATVTLNGTGGGRSFGGVANSSIVITEFKA